MKRITSVLLLVCLLASMMSPCAAALTKLSNTPEDVTVWASDEYTVTVNGDNIAQKVFVSKVGDKYYAWQGTADTTNKDVGANGKPNNQKKVRYYPLPSSSSGQTAYAATTYTQLLSTVYSVYETECTGDTNGIDKFTVLYNTVAGISGKMSECKVDTFFGPALAGEMLKSGEYTLGKELYEKIKTDTSGNYELAAKKLIFLSNSGVDLQACLKVDDNNEAILTTLNRVSAFTGTVAKESIARARTALGEYPANGSFKEKAIWSARDYIIRQHEADGANVSGPSPITEQMVINNVALKDYEKVSILSLYHITSSYDYDSYMKKPNATPFAIQYTGSAGEGAGGEFPNVTKIKNPVGSAALIDAATATYALREYLKQSDMGIEENYQAMYAYPLKLKAIMGLAAGVIKPSIGEPSASDDDNIVVDPLAESEVSNFINTAFGSDMEKARKYMMADLTEINSTHMGEEFDIGYYFYTMQAYNEFAAYGTSLINILGPVITSGTSTFNQERKWVAGLQSLYEAVTWAGDSKLWEYWNAENKAASTTAGEYNSLKKVYDYLLAAGAFSNIDDYDPNSISDSAFKYFFGSSGSDAAAWQLSSDMKTGIVASASFLPMRTNIYDPYTYSGLVPTSWLVNFHAKFGYNRKALYIDTNVDAAVNWQRTGTRGDLRVCTLNDLLYADKDIVLYLDDNLYNVKELADITDKAFNRMDNVDEESSTESRWQKISGAITGLWDVSMESVAKTAEVTTYSQKVRTSVANSDTLFGSHKWSDYLYDMETATSYLSPDDLWDEDTSSTYQMGESGHEASVYSPLLGFAVISGVYLEQSVFNGLNTTLAKNTPVFVSSPTMPYLDEADAAERKSIYNYLLLKNLDSQITIDYATNLDKTSPVYMDVYGNILTESGVVIVPAASNATLWTSQYTPYSAGFFSTYGDDFRLQYSEDSGNLNTLLTDVLVEVDGLWELASVRVSGGSIDMSRLSTADRNSLAAIAEVFEHDLLTGELYDQSLWRMLITEVLRGAPIEYIDKDFEGLNLSHRVTTNGLLVAEKLESLVEALSSKGANTTLSIPNPAYMDGVEYIVFFAYKLLILGTLVIWMVLIYLDAVGGHVGFRTVGKCLLSVVLVLSLILGIPAAFELSYYHSNRALLQKETELLTMLNLEKFEAGQEIGITDIHEPETSTELYLKLATVDIPWYNLFPQIILSSSYNTLEELYSNYEGQHPIAGASDVTVINNGVYVSTSQLFESSTITFSPTIKTLYQQSTGETPASYYTPYYFFLDQLIDKANAYASDNNYYSYTTKVQRGGKLKTLGYVQPYFTSAEFMEEGMDYFNLYSIYDVPAPVELPGSLFYSDEDLDALRYSQWCNLDMREASRIKRIEKINDYAREWVASHRNMIGKVTDETFLKCMALSCAMEHNRVFNTLRADNLEIYELSNEDLLRLSIADKDTVMNTSTMSYARFIFTSGGTPTVYAAALLTLINFVSSWVKPIVTILIFILTCISIFVFRLILRKKNNSLYGYVCTILLMCMVNVVGSIFLKLSMFLPGTGLTPTVCILIQCLVQFAYIFLLMSIVYVALKDWRNMGFQRYNSGFNRIFQRGEYSVDVDTPKRKNGWDYYNMLVERQRRRSKRL